MTEIELFDILTRSRLKTRGMVPQAFRAHLYKEVALKADLSKTTVVLAAFVAAGAILPLAPARPAAPKPVTIPVVTAFGIERIPNNRRSRRWLARRDRRAA